jgi:hypothetical protein
MSSQDHGIAPADARPQKRWPRWRIALAYLILLAISLAAIWLMDGHMMSATAK